MTKGSKPSGSEKVDRRRTRGLPYPQCLTDAQLMAALRRLKPEKYGHLEGTIRKPLDDATVAESGGKPAATIPATSGPVVGKEGDALP